MKDFEIGEKKRLFCVIFSVIFWLIWIFSVFELFYDFINCEKLIIMLMSFYLYKCKLIVFWGKVIDYCFVDKFFLCLFVNLF